MAHPLLIPVPGGRAFRGQMPPSRRACPTDGPNGWYIPQTAAHYAALGLPVPDSLWLCQDASGSLQPTLGSVAIPAGGTPVYQQTLPGWSRKFVGNAAVSNQGFESSDSSFAVATEESFAAVLIGAVDFPTGAVGGVSSFFQWQKNVNPTFGIDHGTGLSTQPRGALTFVHTNAAGTSAVFVTNPSSALVRDHYDGLAHTYAIWRNSATNKTGIASDLESFEVTHYEHAYASPSISLGRSSQLSLARWTLVALYRSANAEQNWPAYLARLRGD